MRGPRISGNTLPSHAPQANTNSPARIRSPSLVTTNSCRPDSVGFRICAQRYSTPSFTAPSTTAATARRAIKTPLPVSRIPVLTSSNDTCGYFFSRAARSNSSNGTLQRRKTVAVRLSCESSLPPSQSTPVSTKSGCCDAAKNFFHCASEFCDHCVYSSSAPYPVRMMRDSPPELARAFAGPYASTSTTFLPRLARCQAVQAPKTPAPTTATSYAFWPLIVQASYQMYLP